MPKIVSKVFNAWEPYMDGRLWQFTEDEWNSMPNWQPMTNTYDGSPFGRRRIQWIGPNKSMYVRYVEARDTRSMEELAGWVSNQREIFSYEEWAEQQELDR